MFVIHSLCLLDTFQVEMNLSDAWLSLRLRSKFPGFNNSLLTVTSIDVSILSNLSIELYNIFHISVRSRVSTPIGDNGEREGMIFFCL